MDTYRKLSSLSTPCISDGAGGLGNLDPAIRPLREEYTLCGPALTARTGINDNSAVYRAIRTAIPGQVLVIDARGSLYNPVAGDFVVGMAKMMGLAGIVADGTVRDIREVKETGLPVFCRGGTIARPEKGALGDTGGIISCGGVSVSPGDWIVGDANGVTVIPSADVERVIRAARTKQAKDEERSRNVLASRESVLAYLDAILA